MPVAIPYIIVAIGAAIGTATAITIAQIAALAASLIISAQAARKARRNLSAQTREHQITVQSASEPHRTIYGRAKVGGPLIYVHSEGSDNKFLHRVVAVASHEIDAWEKFYFNDDELVLPGLPSTVDYSSPTIGGRYMENGLPVAHIESRMGSTTQTAMSIPGGQWTVDHRCLGRALMRVQTNYTANVYTEGLPNPSTLIRGKKLFDNRTGTTYWSQNPALVIRDYLLAVLDVDSATIDQASFDAAANVCDEDVTIDTAATADPARWAAYMTAAAGITWHQIGGTTYGQKRYRINGVIPSDADPGDVLAHMVAACTGYLSYTGGQYRLVAGSYTAPSFTLTEKDLRGPVSVKPRPGRRDRYNEARGTFIGPLNKFAPTDFPVVKSAAFLAADGGESAPMDLDLPFTDDAVSAQRIASIQLQRSRQGLVSVPCTLTALVLRPGDTVALTLPALGYNASPFRVESWEFTEDFGINLLLREEAAALYDWAPDLTIRDPSPTLSLPSPWLVGTVASLTAQSGVAHALIQNDGTIVSRVLISWTTTTDAFNRFVEIETQAFGETTWTAHARAVDNNGSTYLISLHTGVLYSIRARKVNTVGSVGFWSTIDHVVLDVNAVDNLISNSDFTEDLGLGSAFFPDARALRGWTYSFAVATPNIGRNYANGTAWNIGNGGASMFNGAFAAGSSQQILQYMAAAVGVEYEASVYVSVHRCKVDFYLSFRNAVGTHIQFAGGGPDTIDAGAGIIGGPYDPLVSHHRLWLKGIAPAGTTQMSIQLFKHGTNAGSVDSYALWSKALVCIAPVGVTRATATPWTPSEVNSVRGVGEPISSSALGATGKWDVFVSIYQWAAKTSITLTLLAGDTILIDCEYQGVSGTVFPFAVFAGAGIDVVGVGGLSWNTNSAKVNELGWSPQSSADAVAVKCQKEFTATVDQTITVHGAGGAHFASPSTGSGRALLRVYRVKI